MSLLTSDNDIWHKLTFDFYISYYDDQISFKPNQNRHLFKPNQNQMCLNQIKTKIDFKTKIDLNQIKTN